MNNYVWLSLDPVNRKIDFYPKIIAAKLEDSYIKNKDTTLSQCILGEDFFNATVHFHISGSFYQTTPGALLGRAGFKQPGYRSVMRYPILNLDKDIIVYATEIHGEWRITNEIESEIKFIEKIPIDNIINSNLKYEFKSNYWNPEDLLSDDIDKNIVIWEWCKSTLENVLYLSEDYWAPYLYENNKLIEQNFQNNQSIIIKINNTEERKIEFTFNSCYGLQKSINSDKVRNIRRRIINISELRDIIKNVGTIPCDAQFLEEIINFDKIPHEFICCISQEIMKDPVKTHDNHIYDRSSIQKWFLQSNKSPLTGLALESKNLTPVDELKNKIQEFTRLKFQHYNNEKELENN
tara:strand:+ start:7083 stop:8132 length:1050 start_codon:yes stop_codon:yes gene_type:complete